MNYAQLTILCRMIPVREKNFPEFVHQECAAYLYMQGLITSEELDEALSNNNQEVESLQLLVRAELLDNGESSIPLLKSTLQQWKGKETDLISKAKDHIFDN